METIVSVLKRYKLCIALLAASIAVLFIQPDIGQKAFSITWENTLEMLTFLPPIFVLLGLLDVWVDRETMMKYMGENSGIRGGILAFILGSAAAGPLYAAFPVAGVLMKKGAKLMNVFIFIGAWSTTKIPLIVFETATLGFLFMIIRLVLNILGIIVIAMILDKDAPGLIPPQNEKA